MSRRGFSVVSPQVLPNGVDSDEFDEESQDLDEPEQKERWIPAVAPPNDLDEDVYSLAVSDLTRDFELLAHNSGECLTFAARFATDFSLLFGCMFIQFFLLHEVKRFVTARAVHDLRVAYDAFEIGMYTSDPACYETTANGFHRGLAHCFNASAFDDLAFDVQSGACRIPLSHPFFLGTILWIWTVVCAGQIYKTYRQFMGIIVRTKTVDSMQTPFDGDMEAEDGERIVQQLTRPVKILFTFVIFVPKVCMTLYLLWLGCRWLLATNNFGDLILNAVALEFILVLGELLYMAMLPERNRHDLNRTKILPTSEVYNVGCRQFAKVVFFNIFCFAWVIAYMYYFQKVVPDYRWDVAEVCNSWLEERFAV